MKFKYVNFKAVDQFIGRFAPISSSLFSQIIEEALVNLNQGYVHTEAGRGRFMSDPPSISKTLKGVSDKLLKHNCSHSRENAWDYYDALDFDLVHESGDVAK